MDEFDIKGQLHALAKEIRAQTVKIEVVSAKLDVVSTKLDRITFKPITALDASSPTPTTSMVTSVDIHGAALLSSGHSSDHVRPCAVPKLDAPAHTMCSTKCSDINFSGAHGAKVPLLREDMFLGCSCPGKVQAPRPVPWPSFADDTIHFQPRSPWHFSPVTNCTSPAAPIVVEEVRDSTTTLDLNANHDADVSDASLIPMVARPAVSVPLDVFSTLSLQPDVAPANVQVLTMVDIISYDPGEDRRPPWPPPSLNLSQRDSSNLRPMSMQVEESLSATVSQFKMVQEAIDLEQKLASQDASISKLTEELSLHCSSEESLKENSLKRGTELVAVKEELQVKLLSLQEMEMKLEEQVKEKETSETTLEKQQVQIVNLRSGLGELKDENETLKGTLVDTESKLPERDSRLRQAEEEHAKAQLLQSEALSHEEELEENLKSISEQHDESKAVHKGANEKILELESQIQALHAAGDALKSHLVAEPVITELLTKEIGFHADPMLQRQILNFNVRSECSTLIKIIQERVVDPDSGGIVDGDIALPIRWKADRQQTLGYSPFSPNVSSPSASSLPIHGHGFDNSAAADTVPTFTPANRVLFNHNTDNNQSTFKRSYSAVRDTPEDLRRVRTKIDGNPINITKFKQVDVVRNRPGADQKNNGSTFFKSCPTKDLKNGFPLKMKPLNDLIPFEQKMVELPHQKHKDAACDDSGSVSKLMFMEDIEATPSLEMGLQQQNDLKNRRRKQSSSPRTTPKISESPAMSTRSKISDATVKAEIDLLEKATLTPGSATLVSWLGAPWDPGGCILQVFEDGGLRASRMLRRGECHVPPSHGPSDGLHDRRDGPKQARKPTSHYSGVRKIGSECAEARQLLKEGSAC